MMFIIWNVKSKHLFVTNIFLCMNVYVLTFVYAVAYVYVEARRQPQLSFLCAVKFVFEAGFLIAIISVKQYILPSEVQDSIWLTRTGIKTSTSLFLPLLIFILCGFLEINQRSSC